jgi:hypothetical protein
MPGEVSGRTGARGVAFALVLGALLAAGFGGTFILATATSGHATRAVASAGGPPAHVVLTTAPRLRAVAPLPRLAARRAAPRRPTRRRPAARSATRAPVATATRAPVAPVATQPPPARAAAPAPRPPLPSAPPPSRRRAPVADFDDSGGFDSSG